MHLNSFRSRFSAFGFLVLVIIFFSFFSAVAEKQISIPVPVPLLGDYGQAGLAFNGLPWAISPDISALWLSDEGELSFVMHGEITALYRWKYKQGEIALLNVKDWEEDPDSFLLEGAKKQSIVAFFSQGGQLYGLDGTNGHLLSFGINGWQIDKKVDWKSVAQIVGLERIDFEEASNRPYDFVKTGDFLYCLIPRTAASPLLVYINLETQQYRKRDFPSLEGIHAFQDNDLLIKADSRLKRFDAVGQTLTDIFTIDGPFVYDGEQGVLYYALGGLLYESKDSITSRAICTPAMSQIYALVALPQHMLAVYGDKGLSIVNTQLNPGKKIRIQDYFTLSNESELFSLANPDITIEMVNASLSEADFMTNENDLDIITQASVADISKYFRNDCLVPLSGSVKLREIAQTYYPQIRGAISYQNTLCAIPQGFGVSCYQADGAAYEAAGSTDFPKDMDTFFQQVEQFATKDAYDDSQTHLEDILYDLTEQYCAQYATESAPVRFDSPVYRSLLSRMKELAASGVTGSLVYFSASSPGYHQPYGLGELGNDGMIPFAFPCFEPDQTSKLMASLDIFLINARSEHQGEALRFLEFVATYPNMILKYALSPQDHQRPLDIADAQRQVIDLSLSHLQNASVGMDDAARLERVDALAKASRMLEGQRRELTDAGLAFYRENAASMSFQGLGCYDFVVDYAKEPYFCSFLYGSMSVDDLIMMLNARAYDSYALTH